MDLENQDQQSLNNPQERMQQIPQTFTQNEKVQSISSVKQVPTAWIERIFVLFNDWWLAKWSSAFSGAPGLLESAKRTWAQELYGLSGKQMADGLNRIKKAKLEWPPTVFQFIEFCKQEDEMPNERDALQLAVRREWKEKEVHPVVKLAFDKIGSWDFGHMTAKELEPRWKNAYREAREEYFEAQSKAAPKALEAPEPKPEPVKPTNKFQEDVKKIEDSFKPSEHIKKLLREAKEKKIKHPEWDMDKCSVYSKKFDRNEFEKRRKYLLSMNDLDALTLDKIDMYDRMRYKNEVAWSKLPDVMDERGMDMSEAKPYTQEGNVVLVKNFANKSSNRKDWD